MTRRKVGRKNNASIVAVDIHPLTQKNHVVGDAIGREVTRVMMIAKLNGGNDTMGASEVTEGIEKRKTVIVIESITETTNIAQGHHLVADH